VTMFHSLRPAHWRMPRNWVSAAKNALMNYGLIFAAFMCIYAGEAIRAGHDLAWSWQGFVGLLFYMAAVALAGMTE
jgi:hypothetical protein